MKKLLLFTLLVIGMITIKAQNGDFAGGDGMSPGTAYQITNSIQLRNLNNYLGERGRGKYFKLMDDINVIYNPVNLDIKVSDVQRLQIIQTTNKQSTCRHIQAEYISLILMEKQKK